MTCRKLFTVATVGFALSLSTASFAQSTPPAGSGGRNVPKADTPQQPTSEGGGQSGGRAKPKGDDPTAPPSGDAGGSGLLAGPTVEREAQDGRNNPMNSPNNTGKARDGKGQDLPFRQWIETIRAVGVSPEQQQKIVAIVGEFQTAQRNFQQEHGEEMKQLQQEVRTSRESGKQPDPKLREKFETMQDAMPQQSDYQQRIWETLTADQQATARTKLAELEQRLLQQRRANGGGVGGAAGGPAGGGAKRPGVAPLADKPGQSGSEGAGDGAMSPSGNGQRAAGKDDQMTGGAMSETATEPSRAAPNRERLRERRRGGADAIDMASLDASARSRAEFLMQHLSAARPGNEPTPDDKTFKFKEDEGS